MSKIIWLPALLLFLSTTFKVEAATPTPSPSDVSPSPATASASQSARLVDLSQEEQLLKLQRQNITNPEKSSEKEEILRLFQSRQENQLKASNFLAYIVQYAVKVGVPANTVILILLLPVLATIIAFVRMIIGLPSLEMLVPIILSIALISTGITAGLILLFTVLIASFCSRLILKKVKVMQLPKMALSLFVVSIFVFGSLTASAHFGLLAVRQLSIFPVLIFIILSDKIVSMQLERKLEDTLLITLITFVIGILGYLLLTWEYFQTAILLYPELILFLIPINLLVGRYFGLRLTEYFRFSPLSKNGHK